MTLTLTVRDPLDYATAERRRALGESGFIESLVNRDSSLWGLEAQAEASIRLGWTTHPSSWIPLAREVMALREELSARGYACIAGVANPLVGEDAGFARGFGAFHLRTQPPATPGGVPLGGTWSEVWEAVEPELEATPADRAPEDARSRARDGGGMPEASTVDAAGRGKGWTTAPHRQERALASHRLSGC